MSEQHFRARRSKHDQRRHSVAVARCNGINSTMMPEATDEVEVNAVIAEVNEAARRARNDLLHAVMRSTRDYWSICVQSIAQRVEDEKRRTEYAEKMGHQEHPAPSRKVGLSTVVAVYT